MRLRPVLCALAFALPVEAAPITYGFTGTVSQVADPAGTPMGVVPVVAGQQVPILVTLESAFPDSNPSPATGDYMTPARSPPRRCCPPASPGRT